MALNEFEGTVMLVSHDRALLRAVCDEFWMVSQGGVAPFDGDLDDYQKYLLDHAKRMREEAKKAGAAPAVPAVESARIATETIAKAPYDKTASGTFDKTKEVKAASRDNADQRKLDAQRRQQQSDATKPLRKEIEKIDRQMLSLQAEQTQLQDLLTRTTATPEIVATGKRLKLIENELGLLEERWLQLTEQIETAAV